VRHHQELAEDGSGEKFVGITLTTCKDGEVDVKACMYNIEQDCNDYNQDELIVLESLAVMLNMLLIINDKHWTKKQFHPRGDPSAKAWKKVFMDDYSPLHRFVHSLGTAAFLREMPIDVEVRNPRWESCNATTFAVTDMLRFIRSEKPGLVKSTVTNVLRAYKVDTAVFDCLNPIGVSTSSKTATRYQQYQFAQELRQGGVETNRTRHDFVALLFDNIGYKRGGKKPGYLQFVPLFWMFLTHAELLSLGVYVHNDTSGSESTMPVQQQPIAAADGTTEKRDFNKVWEKKR